MRARESVSGRLDGELSELDRAWLDAHLRDCAECSAYAREAEAFTAALRAAPLEQPEPIVLPRRTAQRGRRIVAVASTAAAAAAALAAVGIGAHHAILHRTPPVAFPGAQDNIASLHSDTLRQHRLALDLPQPTLSGRLLVI